MDRTTGIQDPSQHGHDRVRPAERDSVDEGVVTDSVDQLEKGRAAFNRGEYFLAHELWEELWRDLAGVERMNVQGLIQIAAGLHHLQQHRPRPAGALLRKGLAKLSRGTPGAFGHLRIGALVRDVTRLLEDLAEPGSNAPAGGTFRL